MTRWAPPVAVMLVAVVCAFAPAAGAEDPEAARCFRLIALFDEIVQSRFDRRLLEIEAYDLASARRRRDQAEAYCLTGRTWFGVNAIEDALERIGVAPPLPADAGKAPADDQ